MLELAASIYVAKELLPLVVFAVFIIIFLIVGGIGALIRKCSSGRHLTKGKQFYKDLVKSLSKTFPKCKWSHKSFYYKDRPILLYKQGVLKEDEFSSFLLYQYTDEGVPYVTNDYKVSIVELFSDSANLARLLNHVQRTLEILGVNDK